MGSNTSCSNLQVCKTPHRHLVHADEENHASCQHPFISPSQHWRCSNILHSNFQHEVMGWHQSQGCLQQDEGHFGQLDLWGCHSLCPLRLGWVQDNPLIPWQPPVSSFLVIIPSYWKCCKASCLQDRCMWFMYTPIPRMCQGGIFSYWGSLTSPMESCLLTKHTKVP